jgi:hypothetical protein
MTGLIVRDLVTDGHSSLPNGSIGGARFATIRGREAAMQPGSCKRRCTAQI